jgi:hypothetical protein
MKFRDLMLEKVDDYKDLEKELLINDIEYDTEKNDSITLYNVVINSNEYEEGKNVNIKSDGKSYVLKSLGKIKQISKEHFLTDNKFVVSVKSNRKIMNIMYDKNAEHLASYEYSKEKIRDKNYKSFQM